MKRKKDRVETSFRRGLRFGALGLLAGTAFAGAVALPSLLLGWWEMGATTAMVGLLMALPAGGFVGGLFIGLVLQEGIGGLVAKTFQGARGTTRSEHSWLQSLIVRGAYREAVEACARKADESPRDPQPLLLGAEVLRDHLKQHETAARWLRRAREIPKLTAQQDITITRELVGLYENQLGAPKKALPELARIAETYPGTQAATWATNTMKQIKASVWTDVKTDASDTADEGNS
jgi:hypothetical protein